MLGAGDRAGEAFTDAQAELAHEILLQSNGGSQDQLGVCVAEEKHSRVHGRHRLTDDDEQALQ